jgi:peptidoglycan/xylan/chitin deacetylase (PgdA/CDA1 family)
MQIEVFRRRRERVLDALAARSYRLVLGSIFPWDTLRPPLWFVRLFVRLNAHPGGILVLHDTPALSGRTLETLRQIVPELRQRGYRFVPLQELLDPAP